MPVDGKFPLGIDATVETGVIAGATDLLADVGTLAAIGGLLVVLGATIGSGAR